MKKQVEAWLFSAHEDLQVIEAILDNSDLTNMIAFHCQQLIEKSFKAVLESADIKIPKTHNLVLLYDRVENLISLEIDMNILLMLNELYIDSRYPSDIGLLPTGKPSIDEAKMFYTEAQKTLKTLEINFHREDS